LVAEIGFAFLMCRAGGKRSNGTEQAGIGAKRSAPSVTSLLSYHDSSKTAVFNEMEFSSSDEQADYFIQLSYSKTTKRKLNP
jgi:hypothetical protein